MSTPTILDYPGARYLYNVQAGQDAEEYATKDTFTGATADDDGAAGLVPAPEASADVEDACRPRHHHQLTRLHRRKKSPQPNREGGFFVSGLRGAVRPFEVTAYEPADEAGAGHALRPR